MYTRERCGSTRFLLDGHTGCMVKVLGSSSVSRILPRKQWFLIMFMSILTGCWVHLLSPIFLLAMNGPRRVITRPRGSPKETLVSFAFSSLRIGREQHVPDSCNHSLYLMSLLNSCSPEGNCGECAARQHTQHTQHTTPHHKTRQERGEEKERDDKREERETSRAGDHRRITETSGKISKVPPGTLGQIV